MRKGLIAGIVVLTACASASPPPGGPEDKAPPVLVSITPDTNALNVTSDAVVFQFDETINDRGTGPQELDQYFIVSPSDGAPRVSWHRSRIDVRPRRDFRPNTTYTVTMLPGLTDLRGNLMKTGAKVVFSTGPTMPPYTIAGTVFDWAAERPAVHAYMQAITPDSIIYLAQSDSLGKFSLGPLPEGTYLVRAIIDANANRALDRNEQFDTLRVTVPQVEAAELRTALRDTLPARLGVLPSITDSVTLLVTFDRSLDPTQAIMPSQFRLQASDSSEIPVIRVLSPKQLKDEQAASLKAVADSTRRADSLAGKKLAPIVPPRTTTPGGKAPPPPPPTPSLPPPFTAVTLKLGHALAPSTEYKLTATGVHALSGRDTTSSRRFATPKPTPKKTPADSSGAPVRGDSSARPPARPPRDE